LRSAWGQRRKGPTEVTFGIEHIAEPMAISLSAPLYSDGESPRKVLRG
jgi:hypothetical protein